MMKSYKRGSRGFTLIELLVVIAIIGILAAIVLASLSTARTKGSIAAIKEQMNSARNAAEIFYNNQTPNSYGTVGTAGVCTGATAGSLFQDTAANSGSNMAAVMTGITGSSVLTSSDCGAGAAAWSVAVKLTDGSYWCVDSSGVARGLQAGGAVYTALTGAATAAHTAVGSTACN